jgi:hypothetical protein
MEQVILSEQLQLLHQFRYSDLHMPYQAKDSRSRDIRSEVRILDTIAILLTAGRPGEVTAVAFDKRRGLQLVLAKNGPLTSQDDVAAQNLISVLMNPATETAADVFPVIY